MAPTIRILNVGGQVSYVDYLGNVTRLAVELVNAGPADGLSVEAQELLAEHGVRRPAPEDLEPLLVPMRDALQHIVDGTPLAAVGALLERYPPDLHLSDHDGAGAPHIHFARNGI